MFWAKELAPSHIKWNYRARTRWRLYFVHRPISRNLWSHFTSQARSPVAYTQACKFVTVCCIFRNILCINVKVYTCIFDFSRHLAPTLGDVTDVKLRHGLHSHENYCIGPMLWPYDRCTVYPAWVRSIHGMGLVWSDWCDWLGQTGSLQHDRQIAQGF